MFTEEIKNELGKKLQAGVVEQRKGGGGTLSYVAGHHVIREANRIFGFDGWNDHLVAYQIVQEEQVTKKGNNGEYTLWYVSYTAEAKVEAHGVVRSGAGFGQGQDADKGKAHESALKEAATDALKRAMVKFGDPFGLALHDKSGSYIEHEPRAAQRVIANDDPLADTPAGNITRNGQPVSPDELSNETMAAGVWVKRILKTKTAYEDFYKHCTAERLNWVTVALAAKDQNIKDAETLREFVGDQGRAE